MDPDIITIEYVHYCFQTGIIGKTLGSLQYIPWLISFSSLLWGWRSDEPIFVFHSYFIKITYFFVTILQYIFEDPINNEECRLNIFNLLSQYGFPCWETTQSYGSLGFLLFYLIFWKKKLNIGHVIILITYTLVPLSVHISTGYKTYQIIGGCILGIIMSFLSISFIRFYFTFLFDNYLNDICINDISRLHMKKKTRFGGVLRIILGGLDRDIHTCAK